MNQKEYNYLDYIKKPSGNRNINMGSNVGDLGVDDGGWICILKNNIEAFEIYLKVLVTGPAYGNRYYFESGHCKNGSKRKIYIDNVPTGSIFLPGIPAYVFGENSGFAGLLPGIIESIIDVNPVSLFMDMMGRGPHVHECFKNKFKNYKNLSLLMIILFFLFFLN